MNTLLIAALVVEDPPMQIDPSTLPDAGSTFVLFASVFLIVAGIHRFRKALK